MEIGDRIRENGGEKMLTDMIVDNKNYVKWEPSQKENLDSIAIKVIRQDCPEFLLPIRTREIDGTMEVRYEVKNGVRLLYLPEEIEKNELVELLIHMLLPFRDCSDWFLDYHNLVLDETNIFVEKKGRSVSYIYLPVARQIHSEEEIKDFFAKTILKFNIKDDMGYMVQLMRILKSSDSNLMTLLKELQKEIHSAKDNIKQKKDERIETKREEEREESKPKVQQIWHSNEKKQEQQIKEELHQSEEKKEIVFGKRDEAGILMGSLFGENDEASKMEEKTKKKGKEKKKEKEKAPKSGGLFSFLKGKQKEEKGTDKQVVEINRGALDYSDHQNERNISYIQQKQYVKEDDMTQAGWEDNSETMAFLPNVLQEDGILRLRLEKALSCQAPDLVEIDLRERAMTVGRNDKNGKPQSDYNFDQSLSFVSRRHFRVEREDEHWKIIDLESSNGTLLNGKKLVPNVPYSLYEDDVITIAFHNFLVAYRVCE